MKTVDDYSSIFEGEDTEGSCSTYSGAIACEGNARRNRWLSAISMEVIGQ